MYANLAMTALKIKPLKEDILQLFAEDGLCDKFRLGEEGGMDRCISGMSGNVDDPAAFCAALHKDFVGKFPSEKASQEDESKDYKKKKVRITYEEDEDEEDMEEDEEDTEDEEDKDKKEEDLEKDEEDDEKELAEEDEDKDEDEEEDEMFTLKGVEVFQTGEHNGDTYTTEDLDAMVEAFNEAGFNPPLKIGHDETPGQPAVGWLENVQRKGNKLLADITHIPKAVYQVIKKRGYDRVSAEIYWNFKTNGKKFKRALKAVALLGADVPAVTSLKPLHEMFSALGKHSGTLKQYDAPPFKLAKGDKAMADKDDDKTKELEAQVKKLTADLEEARKNSASDPNLKKMLDEQTAQLNAIRTERRNERIAMKTSSLKLPALRPHIQALYSLALGDDGQTKTVKFSSDGKKENEKDYNAEAMLDEMVAHLNEKIEPILKQYGKEDGERSAGNYDGKGPATAEEVDKRTRAYMAEHKVEDYSLAMQAVLTADPELKQKYTLAQN